MDWAAMVMVGRIIRPQHNRGHVVVESTTDFPEVRFAAGASLCVERDGVVTAMTVTESRPHDARWVVGFEGIHSISDAETLRGLELRVPEASLAALEPGTYYIHDLVGCEVWTASGEHVGQVTRVDGGVGAPLMTVGGADGDVLVPFVEAFFRRVDLDARRIEIDPPPGLLDVNRPARR